MNRFSAYNAAALGQISPSVRPLIPEPASPVQQISRVFAYQSYFDNTLLETALLVQKPGEPIVTSTKKEEQIPGYAIALHPSSQTPIALEFKVGAQGSSSQAITLKPGQLVRPHGLLPGVKQGGFSGFAWGLPFGWLGGGLATILVFQTPDAYVHWTEETEVIFHRARFQILAPAGVTDPFRKNWPLRFPWSQALQGATSYNQRGQPVIGVTPTRTLWSLRLETLADPAEMRVYWQGSNDFGIGSTGAIIAAEASYIAKIWGTRTGLLAGFAEYEVEEVAGPLARIAADDGGVQMVSDDADIQDLFVDVVRYGKL